MYKYTPWALHPKNNNTADMNAKETGIRSHFLCLCIFVAVYKLNPGPPSLFPRCPSDRTQVRVEESGSSLEARFSVLLFLFQGDYRDVFLHCSLSLCDQRSSSCTPVSRGPTFTKHRRVGELISDQFGLLDCGELEV
jgi:hypothetical protein